MRNTTAIEHNIYINVTLFVYESFVCVEGDLNDTEAIYIERDLYTSFNNESELIEWFLSDIGKWFIEAKKYRI